MLRLGKYSSEIPMDLFLFVPKVVDVNLHLRQYYNFQTLSANACTGTIGSKQSLLMTIKSYRTNVLKS